MPSYRWIPAFALLLLGCCGRVFAAEAGSPYDVRVWSTKEGLPGSSVIALTQTRDGYLWLGTLYGLVRFDGIQFTTFDENNTPGLNDRGILHLFEDSQGELWIGTKTAGIKLVKDGRVIAIPPEREGFRTGFLKSACEDPSGAVWLYTADGQILRHSGGTVAVNTNFMYPPSNNRFIIAESDGRITTGMDFGLFQSSPGPTGGTTEAPTNRLSAVSRVDYLLASKRGGFWCLADGRIQRWSTNRAAQNSMAYPWNPAGASVNAACEDLDGNLIVGTGGDGVWWFDAEGHANHISDAPGELSHTTVLSLCMDREGTLWVGTDGGGLNRVKRKTLDVVPESLGRNVTSVCANREGGVILGLFYGGLISWKSNVWSQFGPEQILRGLYVRSVLVDDAGTLWAGAQTVGAASPFVLHFATNGTFQLNLRAMASVIHQDRRRILWVGTEGGLGRWDGKEWKLFTTRDGLTSDDIRAIADDADGNLWVGTEGGGLNRLKDGRFTALHKSDGLPSESISSLLVDAKGVLWIGTSGGLARYYGGKWTRYSTSDGLASNLIVYLLEDDAGFLWLGSNGGLMRIRKKSLEDFAESSTNTIVCRTFEEPDGLPTRECTPGSQPAACRTADGKLWFATVRGLACVDPARLRPNTIQPPVVIEAVSIEGQPQQKVGIRARAPESVTVPPGSEHLEIQYTSLNLATADKARFKYRLEGYETGWNNALDRRIAPYSKLPPDKYRFHVIACNEDGVWNEAGAVLAITVLPPFWRTWWFLTASTLCLLGAIVGGVHYVSTQKLQRQLAGLRQQQALEKERARIARDIHDELGASLTQVSLLGELVESDKDSPVDVGTHARQISQTARDTTRVLDEIVWTVNPSNDTLDGLVNYICKYAQEYLGVAELRYRLEVPPQLPEAVISPEVRHNVFLAAKEALTNVVRHAHASAAWVRLKLEADSFILEIQDDGRGLADAGAKKETRSGLRNMGKRMEDLGGKFEIVPAPEKGTIVRLTVPLRKS